MNRTIDVADVVISCVFTAVIAAFVSGTWSGISSYSTGHQAAIQEAILAGAAKWEYDQAGRPKHTWTPANQADK